MLRIFSRKLVYLLVVLFLLFLFNQAGAADDTANINLTTNVQQVITLTLTGGDVDFGYLTPNVPEKGSAGVIAGVTTTAANGYNLGINDNISGGNSCLLNEDGVTRIIDFSSTIASPDLWNEGVSKGLGITVYSADTNKEAKWGTGTTFNDAFNKYAGIPETLTTLHNSPGFKLGEDKTGLGFIVDVNGDQITGVYTGQVIVTATALL